MSETIIDGSGRGYSAKVTENQQVLTLAVMENIDSHHTFQSDGYNYNTGNITLTSGSKSALVYIKNNDNRDIVITTLVYNIGVNAGGSGNNLVQVERNPTGGTIVSNAVAQVPVNRDFGSANTLTVASYKGAEGYTLTGGTVIVESLLPIAAGRQVVSVGSLILRKGNSIGITLTPPTSTSSVTVQMAVAMYIVDTSTEAK
jgi:hypothetical protein